jgi:hypothetical protein
MKNTLKAAALPTLADLEREVVAEYRELGRQELARRLQTAAFGAAEDCAPYYEGCQVRERHRAVFY